MSTHTSLTNNSQQSMSTLSYITNKQQSTINVNPLINHQQTTVNNQCQPSHTSLTNNSQQSINPLIHHQNQWVKEFLLGRCLDYSDSDRTEVRPLSFTRTGGLV